AVRMKALRLAAAYLGDEVDGLVVAVTPRVIFIEMADVPVDGRLPREALRDDHYEFVEERFAYVGRRTGRRFGVGQKVRVVVARVSPETREMEFAVPRTPAASGTQVARRPRPPKRERRTPRRSRRR